MLQRLLDAQVGVSQLDILADYRYLDRVCEGLVLLHHLAPGFQVGLSLGEAESSGEVSG
ncbi:hypothetical protein D1872_332500 [compost metagenome]